MSSSTPTLPEDMGLGLLAQLAAGSARLTDSAQPLRQVIQEMLSLYSNAVLVLAGFVVVYYAILNIVDAAQTGKAFRRMNPLWGPLRLIIAIGILVPIGSGLNTGQYIVLKMAGWGSELASELWAVATQDIATMQPMVATPAPVPAIALVRALVLRDSCRLITDQLSRQLEAAAQKNRENAQSGQTAAYVQPALKPVTAMPETSNGDGSRTTPYGWTERPYFCGAVTRFMPEPDSELPMFALLKQAHIDGLRQLENSTNAYAAEFLAVMTGQGNSGNVIRRTPNALAEAYQETMQAAINKPFLASLHTQLEANRRQLGQLGWVAAPAYLDTILRLNVRLISVNASLPQVDAPDVLLNPPAAPVTPSMAPSAEYKVYSMLQQINQSWGETPQIPPLSAAGLSGLSTILGQAVAISREVPGAGAVGHQLRASRDLLRTNDYNWDAFASSNPLVGLAELGAYLAGKSAELLAGAGILNAVGPVTGPMVSMITVLGVIAFLSSTTLLLLLPVIPLVRFLLGVAVWLVEVFEALIAIPMVALVHLRSDEEGLAGSSAILCYLLVLQVMVRPVLMVLGLLGGLVIFLLTLGVLNTLVAGSITSILGSGQVASLWFVLLTAVYAVLVLGLANAAFKLIDWLPQRTLTWLSGLLQPSTRGTFATPAADPATKG